MLAREDDLAHVLVYLELTIIRKLNGLLRGSFLSTATGEGSEPVGSREYVIGDDVRQMNWAVTACAGVPRARASEAERELECWIVTELATRLFTGLVDTIKWHLLTATAGVVMMLNDTPGSRIGLVASDTPVPAGQGRAHSPMLFKQLADATAEHNLAADINTAMTQALRAGLLAVISDFLGSFDWAHPLCVVSASTEIMAIRLVDLVDEALPGKGPVVMVDSVTGKIIELNINDRTRAEYVAQASAHHEHVVNELRKCRARVITLRTDSDWIPDFVR